jgi:AbrB family looped-hinge helix DNA binding protein
MKSKKRWGVPGLSGTVGIVIPEQCRVQFSDPPFPHHHGSPLFISVHVVLKEASVLYREEFPSGFGRKTHNLRILYSKYMVDTTLVKVSSKGLVTLPKKIRSKLGINDGDYLAISSNKDQIIFRKAKIEIDYENPDDAWKEYSKKRLAHD